MAKMSSWKIVATEGATVDGRAISPNWINEMAEAYSTTEYTALIWPEHNRSTWSTFEGNNWGVVEQLKAEKRDGKLRLLAKITPNEHLLSANAKQQKLFTSIEPEPDYKGQGSCYLMGLAVTDSPASSGTTRLTFSKANGKETNLEPSQLEEIEFSECNDSNLITNAMTTLFKFFQSGGQLPVLNDNQQEEAPMNDKQFKQIEGALASIVETQATQQTQLDEFSKKLDPAKAPDTTPDTAPAVTPPTVETEGDEKQFSALSDQLKTVIEGQQHLQTQFNALKKEVPGQENDGEGASTTVEAL